MQQNDNAQTQQQEPNSLSDLVSTAEDRADENVQESAPADEAGETGEESETSQEAASEGKEEKPAKKNNGFKKKINRLRGTITAKEQEIEYWKAKAMASEKPAEQQTNSKVQAKGTNEKPKEEDYNSHEEWQDAVTEWKVDQRLAERDRAAKEDSLRKESETKVKTFGDRIQAFEKSNPDFREVLEDVEHVKLSAALQSEFLDSENGPRLMYELAKNPEEYERINALPYNQAIKALAKFEAGLEKPAEAKAPIQPKTPKAPPPIKPVGSRGSGTVKDLSEMTDFDEYYRARNEQESKR